MNTNFLKTSFTHIPASLRLAWAASPSASVGIAILTVFFGVVAALDRLVGKPLVDSVVAGSRPLTEQWVFAELGLVAAQALVQRLLFLMRAQLGAKLGWT